MDTPPSPTRCPKCGGHVPGEATQGLGPNCALAAVAMDTEVDPTPAREVPPTQASVAAAFPQRGILVAKLLSVRRLNPVEPGAARFRSYLPGVVKHFLAEERDRRGRRHHERALVKQEIARTVDAGQVTEELRYLVGVLARAPTGDG